jgi:hypothetical protein
LVSLGSPLLSWSAQLAQFAIYLARSYAWRQ